MIEEPGQVVCNAGVATALGIGLTTTVTLKFGPVQPLAVGVIAKVINCGVFVLLIGMPLIVPDPPAAMPVILPVLSLLQLNTVPVTFPLGTIGVIAEPEQVV